MVSCEIKGMSLNVGAQIVSELKDFNMGSKKGLFLPGLVSALCRRVGVP